MDPISSIWLHETKIDDNLQQPCSTTRRQSTFTTDPNAYWCADCWRFTLDCAHLVEPLTSPEVKLSNFQYLAAKWQKGVLQVTMNTGERYQFFGVPRWRAVLFVKNPEDMLKGYRFERVKGRVRVAQGRNVSA